jgi:hypothetical protein
MLSEVFDHGVILVSWQEDGETVDNFRAFGNTHVQQALCKAAEDMVLDCGEIEFDDDDETQPD